MRKVLWYTAGMISLLFAYIGFVTPGIPFSIFLVFSAYAFARSSPRMHNYIMNHKHFGPFLTGWVEKRIFPQRFKYAMIIVMSANLGAIWLLTTNVLATLWSGIFMFLVGCWCWRYPGSEEEYQKRLDRK